MKLFECDVVDCEEVTPRDQKAWAGWSMMECVAIPCGDYASGPRRYMSPHHTRTVQLMLKIPALEIEPLKRKFWHRP